jgi:phospho-N-acetylmuramoyl-pentapeptide-transferase
MVNFAIPAAIITGFLLAALPGERAIGLLRKLNARQNISEDAPASHQAKQGTPTMGGLLILASITITTLLYIAFSQLGAHRHAVDDWALLPILLVTLAFGGIGFADDYLSAKRGKNLGLRAREKLAAQILVASLFLAWTFLSAKPGLTTYIEVIPASLSETGLFRAIGIVGPLAIDLHWLYYPAALLYIVGMSNATNITDGLDGLSSGITIVMSLATCALVYAMRPELGIFCAALAGALGGFLWWNAHPARVFMGDTCSLALGAGLAAVSMAGKQEIGVIIASSVCWAELLSVMVQVTVFKLRKKRHGLEYAQKNRLFKRAPLHHHFEECGWKETQVVVRFWIAAALMAAVSLLWIRG